MTKHLAGKRSLSLIDRLRGWHYRNGQRVRNYCGCVIA